MISPEGHILKRLKGLQVKRPGLAFALWGEAGIGKTHTTQNLLRELPYKNSTQHATTTPAQVLLNLPKPKILAAWVTRTLEKLERHEGLALEQITVALGAVLSSLAPFVLHLEDVHETNPEQLEWIQVLAKVILQTNGVALIVTSRTPTPEPFENLRLEPLDFGGSKNLLEVEARAALPSEALDWIYGKAAGNPLFTVEYFRFLARFGFIWNDAVQWRFRKPEAGFMPVTVEALIEQLLEKSLSNPVLKNVFAVKAFLPRGSSQTLWARVAGVKAAELVVAKSELMAKGLLLGEDFAHPLFREVGSQKTSVAKRQDFARKALKVLQNNPLQGIDFLEDAALPIAQNRQWFERAIVQANETGNPALACDLRIQALQGYEPAEQHQLALEIAKDIRVHHLPKAASLFERFMPQSTDDIFIYAEVLARLGRLNEAKKLLEEMPEALKVKSVWLEHLVMAYCDAEDHVGAIEQWGKYPSLRSSQNPKFLYKVAQSLTMLSRFQDAEIILEFALQQTPSETLQADIFFSKGVLNDFVSNQTSAQSNYQAARAIYERHNNTAGLGAVLYRLGSVHHYHGPLSEAVRYLEASIACFATLGDQAQGLQSLTLLAATRIELNQCQSAEQELLEVEEQLRNTSFHAKWIMTCTNLSYLYRGWDVPYGAVLALKYARAALRVAREINNPRLIANCLYHVSKSETFAKNPSEGLNLADQCLALGNKLEYPAMMHYPHHARYQALWALNRNDEALQALKTAETKFRNAGSILDADFYNLEYQCLTQNWQVARELFHELRAKEYFFFAQIASRHFPELEQTSLAKPVPELYLSALGKIQIAGKPVQGRKRQELLIRLLEARLSGKPELSALELTQNLYPNDESNRAASSLRELIRSTRADLGANCILTSKEGYALGNVQSDVEAFLKTSNSSLWQGSYLQGLSITGAESIRESLALALQASVQNTLEFDPKEASRVSRFLLELHPYNFDCLALSLKTFQASDNYKTLGRVYLEARARFVEVGEILPERWQDFLNAKAAKSP